MGLKEKSFKQQYPSFPPSFPDTQTTATIMFLKLSPHSNELKPSTNKNENKEQVIILLPQARPPFSIWLFYQLKAMKQ